MPGDYGGFLVLMPMVNDDSVEKQDEQARLKHLYEVAETRGITRFLGAGRMKNPTFKLTIRRI